MDKRLRVKHIEITGFWIIRNIRFKSEAGKWLKSRANYKISWRQTKMSSVKQIELTGFNSNIWFKREAGQKYDLGKSQMVKGEIHITNWIH